MTLPEMLSQALDLAVDDLLGDQWRVLPEHDLQVTKLSMWHPVADGECMHDRGVRYSLAVGYQRHVDDGSACFEMIKTKAEQLSKRTEESP